MDFIHFFGTTGSKEIFFKKIRQAGGLYLKADDTNIIIDPGVNTFYKYINNYEDELDGIILSHIHIDHSNDLNIFVELMTDGGNKKRGTLLIPNQAIEDKILQKYLMDFPKDMHIIKPKTKYKIKNIEIETSIEHRHGVENYGFVITTKKNKIGIVTDTGYFEELLETYKKCNILIMNVPYNVNSKPNPKHMDIPAVEEFIKQVKPQKLLLTHFNSDILKANPVLIAKELSKQYNLEVIAVQDDMIFYL